VQPKTHDVEQRSSNSRDGRGGAGMAPRRGQKRGTQNCGLPPRCGAPFVVWAETRGRRSGVGLQFAGRFRGDEKVDSRARGHGGCLESRDRPNCSTPPSRRRVAIGDWVACFYCRFAGSQSPTPRSPEARAFASFQCMTRGARGVRVHHVGEGRYGV